MKTPIDRYLAGFITSRRESDDGQHDGITKDYAFNRMSFDNGDIHSPLDNNQIQVGTDGLRVKLVQPIDEDKLKTTLSRAINATLGVDLDNPPEEADWEEMLKGGLQTALETQVIVFEVSGASRALTHQLVRTRKASFHQQSMRAHFYGEHPEFRMPESVWRNRRARHSFALALGAAHEAYRIACQEDVSYQDARFILPEGTTNYILCEYPVREFLNVYAYRACSMFQWEIVHTFREMRRVLLEAHPWMEPYVKISCEKTKGALDERAIASGSSIPYHDVLEATAHHCTFQGWEEVEGQCDFPWARESNRSFKSEQHTIKRGG